MCFIKIIFIVSEVEWCAEKSVIFILAKLMIFYTMFSKATEMYFLTFSANPECQTIFMVDIW